MLNCQCEEIDVRQLPRPMNPRSVRNRRVKQGKVSWPELMKSGCSSLPKERDGLCRWNRLRISGLTDDADEAILGEWARCPSASRSGSEPGLRALVVSVRLIEEGDQHIDIQQGSHQ